MPRQIRFTFAVALICAVSACGSRADQPVLPADAATLNTNTGPAPADSTSAARGPGGFGSGS